jgi:Predicted tagatose 6-phosphate kinase
VVQPGVEFGDATVIEYDRQAAKALVARLESCDGLVFEGHSTDYQTQDKLKEMVEDGIAILKVGPALTFALREAIFALNDIEEEVLCNRGLVLSKYKETLDRSMIANAGNWKKHYHGDEAQVSLKRKYSFSDRCRYYLPDPRVQSALETLIKNIDGSEIPLGVLQQYLPIQYRHIREGRLKLNAEALMKDRIKDTIDEYLFATV